MQLQRRPIAGGQPLLPPACSPRPAAQRRGHLGSAIKDNVEHLLRHKNPFHVEHQPGVLAFEVVWSDVVGMDYSSRLMEDTRLVLEARHLAKRVFDTVRGSTRAARRAVLAEHDGC